MDCLETCILTLKNSGILLKVECIKHSSLRVELNVAALLFNPQIAICYKNLDSFVTKLMSVYYIVHPINLYTIEQKRFSSFESETKQRLL